MSPADFLFVAIKQHFDIANRILVQEIVPAPSKWTHPFAQHCASMKQFVLQTKLINSNLHDDLRVAGTEAVNVASEDIAQHDSTTCICKSNVLKSKI